MCYVGQILGKYLPIDRLVITVQEILVKEFLTDRTDLTYRSRNWSRRATTANPELEPCSQRNTVTMFGASPFLLSCSNHGPGRKFDRGNHWLVVLRHPGAPLYFQNKRTFNQEFRIS